MKFASATNLDRNSGERSGGICSAPSPQTKALQVSSQILPKPCYSVGLDRERTGAPRSPERTWAIETGRSPDFPLRYPRQARVCGFH